MLLFSSLCRYKPYIHDLHKPNKIVCYFNKYINEYSNNLSGLYLGEFYTNPFLLLESESLELQEIFKNSKPVSIGHIVKLLCSGLVSYMPIGELKENIYHHIIYKE